MDDKLAGEAAKLASQAQDLATNLRGVAQQITDMAAQGTLALPDGHMPFVSLLTIFALACFVGALLAAGLKGLGAAQLFGAIAVALAAVNIFGGFIVTHRMLSMFKKKP